MIGSLDTIGMTSQKQRVVRQDCALQQSDSSGVRSCGKGLLREILENTNSSDQFMNKATKLNNLNRFVRFVIKFPPQKSDYKLPLEDLLSCLCYMLVDQDREVRAAALRSVRYLIRSPDDVVTLFRLKTDLLIVRSLDTVVDNAVERMQSLMLIEHLVHVDAESVPFTIIRCLHAFCKLDFSETDRISRAATAILSEIVLMRPNVLLQLDDISWLVKSILGASSERIIECLLGLICRLTNYPRYREKLLGRDYNIFQELLAPFCDPHFTLSSSDKNERTDKIRSEADILLENSKAALRCALRNWCGIISCFAAYSYSAGNCFSPMKSIMDAFCHVPVLIQVTFIDCLIEILRIRPRITEMANRKGEAEHIIDDVSVIPYELDRQRHYSHNLSTQIEVFIASKLIECGIVQVFVEYLTKDCGQNSLVDKVLLILNYLTIQVCHLYDYLPFTSKDVLSQCLNAVPSNVDSQAKQNVKDSIEFLYKAANLSLHSETTNFRSLIFERLSRRNVSWTAKKQSVDFKQLIVQSKVASCIFSEWDYSKIHALLLSIGSGHVIVKNDDVLRFLNELMKFFDVDNGEFRKMRYCEEIRLFGRLGCFFTRAISSSSYFNTLVKPFMDKLHIFLEQPACKIIAAFNASPALAHYLYFIGEISSNDYGLHLLTEKGIYSRLGQILKFYEATENECAAKFIVVSLNYSKSAECQRILRTVLTSHHKRLKRFCINFLYSLSLLNSTDISDLCIDLLFESLKDTNLQNAILAARFLHQMALDKNYRDVISRKDVTLDGASLQRYLFRCYNFHDENYVRHHAKEIGEELDMWKEIYNLKYVDVVDDYLTSNLTNCQLSVSGEFLRPSDEQKFDSYFLPPHIYGALSSTRSGKSILKAHSCLEDAVAVTSSVHSFDDLSIKTLKAAIYCLGHLASSCYFKCSKSASIADLLHDILTSHFILTVRSAAYHALNLIAYNQHPRFRNNGQRLYLNSGKIDLKILGRSFSFHNLQQSRDREQLLKSKSMSDCHRRRNDFHLSQEWSNVGIKNTSELTTAKSSFIPKYDGINEHNKSFCINCSRNNISDYQHLKPSDRQGIDEAIKLMCCLTIRRQYSEQRLLKIKQETPHIFNSICFYSDLCDLLRLYDFDLNSRRFVQELFYDTSGLPNFFQSIAQSKLLQEE